MSKLTISFGLTLLAGLGLALPAPVIIKLTALVFLTAFWPGYLLLAAIGLWSEDRLEQIVLAIGVSYGLTILASLGGVYIFGYLSAPLLIGLLGLVVLILLIIGLWRPLSPPSFLPLTLSSILLFSIPVAVAAFFSFTNLGYADYWGDEMNGVLRALSVSGGRVETIFEHTKGPVEILLPAVYGLLTGRFEPFALRFPFALAYVAAIGGYGLLARRLFGPAVGLAAALILSINGLNLAFARMVQYQSVVLLMTALALLLVYQFYQKGQAKYLVMSLFLLGIGLLAHYDMLLVLPPLAYLIWRRYGWRWSDWRANWPYLAGAGLVFLAVSAIFYLPFLLNTHLTGTSSYLSRRILGDATWPANNFDELYQFAVMYNSSYSMLIIALLGLAMLVVDLSKVTRRHYRDRWLWLAVGVTLMLAVAAVLGGRASFAPLLVSLLLLGMLLVSPALSTEHKIVYLWFGVSFIGYVFLVDHPRTHLRVIYPGWLLLAALALMVLFARLRRWLRVGAIVILCLFFGLCAYYQYLLFVDSDREYILTYPAHKNPLYWEDPDFPFGSRRLYGAPHRLGWQMVQQLYHQGQLQGDWASNDAGSNLFWYTLGWPDNPCYPRYYFLSRFEQRKNESSPFNLTDYVKIGEIWQRDRLEIELYEFAPINRPAEVWRLTEPLSYDSAVLPGDFQNLPYVEPRPIMTNILPAPALFRPSSAALAQIAAHYGDPRITQVRDKVALLGYDLDDRRATSGGLVVLTLYWQAVETVNLPYKIFTHLEGDKLWSQADDVPACGTATTQRWSVGGVVADRHVLRLPAEIPLAELGLMVGLYEPATGVRLDLLDAVGNPAGNALTLTRVIVAPK